MAASEANNYPCLTDKVAVITGGGGVLCSTIARALGAQKARVAVLDLLPEAAEKTAEAINAAGGRAMAVENNVLDKADLEAAREKVLGEFGRIDLLINGAGGNKKEATTSDELSFFDLPAEALKFVFELNIVGTILPCQVFGKTLAEQGSGAVLNISSMSAFAPLTKIPGYSAAKAAVSNFTAWLAVHISQNYSTDVRVNAIAPGFFLTEQNRFLLTDSASGELTARGKTIVDHTPMGRFGDPEDLLGCVLWLLSDGAKFIHGTVIPIDGGFNAFSGV